MRIPATSEPAPGLGDPEAADLLALDPGHQVALLLILGAEHLDRRQDHVGVDREAHAEAAGAGVGEALGPDQRVVVVAALAAVLLGEAEADEAELAHPLQRRVGPQRLLPLVGVGASSFSTHDFIDSRRSSCSSVKIRCLRAAA